MNKINDWSAVQRFPVGARVTENGVTGTVVAWPAVDPEGFQRPDMVEVEWHGLGFEVTTISDISSIDAEEMIGRHATPSAYPATDNLVALYRVWALIGADCYPNEGKHARIVGDQ